MFPLFTIIFVHVVLSTLHVVDTQGSLASLNSATNSCKSEFLRSVQKSLLLCQFPTQRVLWPGSCLPLQPQVSPLLCPHTKQ